MERKIHLKSDLVYSKFNFGNILTTLKNVHLNISQVYTHILYAV